MRPSAALLQSLRLLCWLDLPWRQRNDSVTKGGLELTQILTDPVKVRVELLSVFHAVLPHFSYERVFHGSSPRNASGGTISGHSYPAFSTI